MKRNIKILVLCLLPSSVLHAGDYWWLTSQTHPSVNTTPPPPPVATTPYTMPTLPTTSGTGITPSSSASTSTASSSASQQYSSSTTPAQSTTGSTTPSSTPTTQSSSTATTTSSTAQPMSVTTTVAKPTNITNNATGITSTQWSCSTVDSSGNMILGGTYQTGTSGSHFAVAWVSPNSTLSTMVTVLPSFMAAGSNDQCKAITTDSQANVLVAGTSTDNTNATRFAVARLTPQGVLDTTFGTGGGVRIAQQTLAGGTNDQCTAVALDANGNVILGGSSADTTGHTYCAAVSLSSIGVVNQTFGTAGVKLIKPTIAGGSTDQCHAITIDSSNNINLLGTSVDSAGNTDLAVARIAQ